MGWTTQMAVRTRAAIKRAGQGRLWGVEGVRCHLIVACSCPGGCWHAWAKFAMLAERESVCVGNMDQKSAVGSWPERL